jgi:hypothetical protein
VKLVGAGNQSRRDFLYDASNTIVAGGTAQLVMGRSQSRSLLLLQNLSSGTLVFEFGGARATCALTSGAVSSFTITNAGFNYTKPPLIRFEGGGNAQNSSYLGLNQPSGESPPNPATAIAVLSSGALSSITLTNPGSGYVIAPNVFIFNSDLDPYGVALPATTPTAGNISLAAGSAPLIFNGTCCPTDQISVIGATTGQAYACKWMD